MFHLQGWDPWNPPRSTARHRRRSCIPPGHRDSLGEHIPPGRECCLISCRDCVPPQDVASQENHDPPGYCSDPHTAFLQALLSPGVSLPSPPPGTAPPGHEHKQFILFLPGVSNARDAASLYFTPFRVLRPRAANPPRHRHPHWPLPDPPSPPCPWLPIPLGRRVPPGGPTRKRKRNRSARTGTATAAGKSHGAPAGARSCPRAGAMALPLLPLLCGTAALLLLRAAADTGKRDCPGLPGSPPAAPSPVRSGHTLPGISAPFPGCPYPFRGP